MRFALKKWKKDNFIFPNLYEKRLQIILNTVIIVGKRQNLLLIFMVL